MPFFFRIYAKKYHALMLAMHQIKEDLIVHTYSTSQANFIIGDICILAVWSYACHRKLHVIALLLRSGLGLNSTWIRYNPGLKILSPLMCVALFPVQLRLTRA